MCTRSEFVLNVVVWDLYYVLLVKILPPGGRSNDRAGAIVAIVKGQKKRGEDERKFRRTILKYVSSVVFSSVKRTF